MIGSPTISTMGSFGKDERQICGLQTFDEFYDVFLRELLSDLDIAYEYDNKYNRERAKDINYISSLFFHLFGYQWLIAKLILERYELMRRGKSFGEIRRVADKKVAEKLNNVI